MIRLRWWTGWALAAAMGAAVPAVGAWGAMEPGAAVSGVDKEGGVRFLRVFAPADRVQDWPLGDVKYVPLEAAEFERLARLAQQTPAPSGAVVGIARAEYSARLAGDQLVDGKAALEIYHKASGDVALGLGPCALAVRNPRWIGADGKPTGPALLGLAENGSVDLVVPGPGRLEFDWSLRGRSGPAGAVEIEFRLPPCPDNRLVLDLPEALTPALEHGIASPAGPGDAEGRSKWLLELGGRRQSRVRLVPRDVPQQYRQLVLVRQSTVCDFTRYGVEVSASLQLDVHNEPLHQVVLLLDSGLDLVSAQLGGTDAAWSGGLAGEADGSRVTVRLPAPVQGTGQVLRLAARGPLRAGAPWQVPRIRPEGLAWQQGSTTLLVPAPLVIQQLTPVGCRQSKSEPLPAPRVGKSLEFQPFSPDASVEIVLGQALPALRIDTGTAVELSERQMSCRVQAKVRAEDGEHFVLEADVGRRWLIDSVEASPATQVEDWSMEAGPNGTSRLTIRLTRPVSAARPVQLVIAGRRLQSPLGRPLRAEDVAPLRFAGAPGGKRLVAVRTAGPSHELTPAPAGRPLRIDPRTLDRADLELFEQAPEGFLFQDDSSAEALEWTVESRTPTFLATAWLEAVVSGGTLTERCRLECVPQGARVDRVIVQFSDPRPEPVRWSLGAESDRQWTARRLSAEEQAAAGVPSGAEAWEIVVRPSRSGRFEVHGERTTVFSGETRLALVGLPDAGAQQGTLTVRSAEAPAPRIVNHRLAPVPSEASPARPAAPAVLGTFRYDPLRDAAPRRQPAILLAPGEADAPMPDACAWRFRLESRMEADGTGAHTATYWLENPGRARLTVTLPEGVLPEDLEGVWLDGARARWRARTQDREARTTVAVDLTAGRVLSKLGLCFRTRGEPLRAAGPLAPPLPEIDVPVLSRQWTVWLPPGFEAVCPGVACRGSGPDGLSVSERLFGPLGRGWGRSPFDPLSASDWQGLVRTGPERQECRNRTDALLQAIGAGPPDWGTALDHEAARRLGLILLVDRQGLQEAGVGPKTPLAVGAQGAPPARGAEAMRQAGLAVLVHEKVLVMTSAARAALWGPGTEGLGDGIGWRVASGPLADQIAQAAAGKADPALVPADVWRDSAESTERPWAVAAPGLGAADTPGWTAVRMELPEGSAWRVRVVYRGQSDVLYWAALVGAGAMGCWVARRRPALAVLAMGGLGAGALVAPESWTPALSGGFSGVAAGVAWWLATGRPGRRTAPARTPDPAIHPSSTVAHVTGAACVAALVLWCARHGAGEDAAAPAAPVAVSAPYRVFIPIDDKEQPTGDRYQVPEPLYRELRRREQAAGQPRRGWLLRGAVFRGELAWDAARARLDVARLTAVLDLEVVGSAARILVPFGREGANLLPGGASLDGRPIEPEWTDDGALLGFQVPDASRSLRLELALRPATLSGDPMGGFDLAVPPVPGARLELTAPADAPPITVPSAFGAVTSTEDSVRRVGADLGPTRLVSVRWAEGTGKAASGQGVEVEQLLWLQLQPGSVVLDARLKLTAPEGRLDRVRLAADPRLRLLPLEGPNAPSVRTDAPPGQATQTLEFRFAEPAKDQAAIAARFLVAETTGLGNVRLPRLEVLDARVTRRWLAVSVDGSLEYPDPAPGRPQAVAVPEFLGAWGKADAQPRFVDSLPAANPAWTLVTRPRTPNTSVEQTLALGCGERAIRAWYDARLATTGGYSFQHRLKLPADLEVESVSVTEAGVERAARWARGPDGNLTVFLNAPVAGKHELSLRGRLPAPARGRRDVPQIEVEGAESEWATLELFRQPEVAVRLSKTDGLTELETPVFGESKAALGRLVKVYSVDTRQKPAAEVAVTANRPEIEAREITSLRADGDTWEAAVDLVIRVRRGLLDELRLEAPASWSGPFKTSPPVPVSLVELPEAGRRHLVIRPAAAIEREFRVRVAGPLSVPAGQAPAVPDIFLRGADQTERFLVLPTQRQLQPIVWETRGLERTAPPKEFTVTPVGPDAFAAYRVLEKDFRASLRTLDEEGDLPEVRLADVRVAWQADGACYGTAAFYVVPAGEDHCPLELPAGWRLLDARVEGNPARLVPGAGPGRFSVALTSDSLPQEVEVVFAGALPDVRADGTRQFAAPRLGDWPVKATLWAVYPPQDYTLAEPEGVGRVTRFRQATYRLRAVAGLIETAAAKHAAQRDDFARWYRGWTARLAAGREEVRRELAIPPQTDFHRTVRAECESLELRQARIAESLGLTEARSAAAASPWAGDPGQLWLLTLDRPGAVSRSVVHGASEGLALRYSVETASVPFRRWLQAALVGLIAMAIAVFGRRGAVTAVCARWPHVLGVAAGLAWWLWLSPSFLGWVIVVGSLAASARAAWRPRRSGGRLLAVGTPGR